MGSGKFLCYDYCHIQEHILTEQYYELEDLVEKDLVLWSPKSILQIVFTVILILIRMCSYDKFLLPQAHNITFK